jgi:hypothetical protein
VSDKQLVDSIKFALVEVRWLHHPYAHYYVKENKIDDSLLLGCINDGSNDCNDWNTMKKFDSIVNAIGFAKYHSLKGFSVVDLHPLNGWFMLGADYDVFEMTKEEIT